MPICKADALEDRIIWAPLEYRDRITIVENVPAEVRGQCGEILLRPEVAKDLEKLVSEAAAVVAGFSRAPGAVR